MSNTKKWKGQDQVVIGSPTGEPLVTFRFDVGPDPCADMKYAGEAKRGSSDSSCKWFIELFEYDAIGNPTAIKIASNMLQPTATNVDLDITANPGLVTITLTGGSFFDNYVAPGDKIELKTPLNHIKSKVIEDISDTVITVKDISVVAETTSTIDILTISLTNDKTTKDFDQRRWDLRDFYVYN